LAPVNFVDIAAFMCFKSAQKCWNLVKVFYDNGAKYSMRSLVDIEVAASCASMAKVLNASKVGLEKYPRQESRNILYGTAGFRTR
jgi:hypothetical protein